MQYEKTKIKGRFSSVKIQQDVSEIEGAKKLRKKVNSPWQSAQYPQRW